MLRSLMTAASGMKAQQMQVDTIANNIANVNTSGFKKSQLSFRSLLYETVREPGARATSSQMDATGLQVGSGVEISGSRKMFTQGELQPSSPDDIAIMGEGFFPITMPNGETYYTRNGTFRVDGNGTIVTAEGYPLEGVSTVPPDRVGNIMVAEDGTVSVLTAIDQPPSEIGSIQLARFPNPTGLKAQGRNYYSETASSGAPSLRTPGDTGTGATLQGYLERSNVQTVDELVGLIVAQRNYEVNSRAIRVSDEMLEQVTQLVR